MFKSSNIDVISSKSDISEDNIESIETLDEINPNGRFKAPIPRPRTNTTTNTSRTRNDSDSGTSIKSTTGKISTIGSGGDNSSYVTSKSDSRLYKDSLRSRFHQIKTRSSKSLLKAKQKGAIVLGKEKRRDDATMEMIRQENLALLEKIGSSERAVENNAHSSNSEKYLFFCEVTNNQSANVNRENEVDDGDLVQCLRPEDLSMLTESVGGDILGVMRAKTLPKEPLGDSFEIYSNDGIYKPKPPSTRNADINIVKRRLLETNNPNWFDNDGHLIFLENPKNTHFYKPDTTNNNIDSNTLFTLPKLNNSQIPEEVLVIGSNTTLNLTLKSLKFTHHPLFSVEHVYQQRLIDLYDSYREYIRHNKEERLAKRLEALRRKIVNLYNAQNNSGDHSNASYESTIDNIKKEVQMIREVQFEIGRRYRVIVKKMLLTWKNIKRIREKNSFSNTSIKLIIRKTVTNLELDEVDWSDRIEVVTKEILEETKLVNNYLMATYKKSLRKFKTDKTVEEPKKPVLKNVDPDIVQSEVTEQFTESFRWPGEPILNFTISYDNAITKSCDFPGEVQRRTAVTSTKLHFKILCNKILVCKSKVFTLSENFTVLMDESVCLKPDSLPENSIELELYEQTGNLLKRLVASITINIPAENQRIINESSFDTKLLVHYKHEGVGTGDNVIQEVARKFSLVDCGGDKDLNLSGVVSYVFNIDGGSDGNRDYGKLVDDASMKTVVENWTKEVNADPENPKNSAIFDYLQNLDGKSEGILENDNCENNTNYFRLNPELEPMQFCSPEELQDNLRFKLLQLREQNEPEFVGMIIPNRIKEIPENILVSYQRRTSQNNSADLMVESTDETCTNEIITRRSHGRKQLRQIHMRIFQMCKSTQNNLMYEDVVDEKSIPQIQLIVKTLVLNFFNWFKIQPSLSKPIPKIAQSSDQLKSIHYSSSEITTTKSPRIIFQILSGINFPKRKSSDNDPTTSNSEIGNVLQTLRPFVEISLNNMTVESNVVEEQTPKWNEELIIPLETSSTDFLGPNSMTGSININIFDEIESETENSPRKVKWLGFLSIPVSSICCSSSKMEGFFPVNPNVLFEYEVVNSENAMKSPITNNKLANRIYLEMKVTVQPFVSKLSPDLETLACNEPPFLKDHILRWNQTYNSSHVDRRFSPLVLDHCGRSTCVTRFIRSLEPPQINREGFDVSAEQCAKYIATIPFTDANQFYQNIWLYTEQLLKLMIGSIIDHAVALTCYLMALNLNVWLVLGFSVPYGSSACVLEREHVTGSDIPIHYIYDIGTGQRFSVTDPLCPLQRIYCVINDTNVWANIQRENDLLFTRLDFLRRFDWMPLFNNQITAPTNSIQQRLVYTHSYDVTQLEATIESKLRKKISKSRRQVRTVWNRSVCVVLKNVLSKFEISFMHGRRQSGYERNSEFKNMLRNYNLKGCIMNIPFGKVSTVLDLVQTTRLFDESNNNEFVLAISIQPYPNNILNLWIAVGYTQRSTNS